ncbi:hypothetical protein [Sulfitobacter sp.]|uniref:hypothetical protein n=1 Tax=Sulfitobacter sp. TaxID=1903071 RepID=UPI003299BA2F
MTKASPFLSGHGAVIAALLLTIGAMIAVNQLPQQSQQTLLQEGGLIETLAVVGYAVCIGLMFLCWGLRQTRVRWYFPVMAALLAGRELDLDKLPFTEGLLKSRQYIGDTVPVGERTIALAILATIIGTTLTLLRREAPAFLRGLRSRRPAAYAVLFALALIIISKTIDGLGRKLAGFGIDASQSLTQTAFLIEEISETGIPLMLATAIVLTTATAKTASHSNAALP